MFRTLPSCVAPSLLLAIAFAGTASATITYDQNVTTNVIFGAGNSNGGFAVDQENGVQLGLEAHVRYPLTVPTATLSQHDGTYGAYDAGSANGPAGRSTWNFDWSINSNYDGNGANLSAYTYQMLLDTDPGVGVNFVSIDPSAFAYGGSIGNNSTPSGGGTTSNDPSVYASLLANNNLLQNSGQFEFYLPPGVFNPNVGGTYTIELEAFSGANLVAMTSIDVLVQTPEPASILSMAAGLGALALFAWRRKVSALQS